jgi:hypothetical protein
MNLEEGKDEFVEIQEIQTDYVPVYVVKVAGINLRGYLSKDDANRIAAFMRTVVDSILTTGKGVEVQELKSDVLPIYLLKIGGISSRAYLSKAEMTRTVDYMSKIVDAILK